MKVNRQPVPAFDEETLRRDHEFWKQYSRRLTGDVFDYDTTVKQLTDWVQKTYVQHDLSGFTGDPKFLRDIDAQKSFSKLRSAIAGIYAWRIGPDCPVEYRPKSTAEYQRLLREAEFAFCQAFAFCPWNPDAMFHYINLLSQVGRVDDDLLLVDTCLKLDPYNAQVIGLQNNLRNIKQQRTALDQAVAGMPQLEEAVRKNPTNFQTAFDLASLYLQLHETNRVVEELDRLMNQPYADAAVVLSVAKAFAQIQNVPKLESALQKLVHVAPDNPDAWYDLAAIESLLHKPAEALSALNQALTLGAKRRERNPEAPDLAAQARSDARFAPLRGSAEFQRLVRP